MIRLGRPRRHYRVTDSTNERGRELARAGAPAGTVVTAGEQTAGRGRRGRTWIAPAGAGLLYSALLRELGPEQALLPLAVPLAVCEAIESLAPLACRVKWPNDVWIAEGGDSAAPGRKVAGVLIEAQLPAWAVVGIGVNVAVEEADLPADLRHPAASIGHGVDVEETLAAVNERLGRWAFAPPARVRAEFAQRDALHGLEVRWTGAGAGVGRADGIDARGNLVVVRPGGERTSLGAGEVLLASVVEGRG